MIPFTCIVTDSILFRQFSQVPSRRRRRGTWETAYWVRHWAAPRMLWISCHALEDKYRNISRLFILPSHSCYYCFIRQQKHDCWINFSWTSAVSALIGDATTRLQRVLRHAAAFSTGWRPLKICRPIQSILRRSSGMMYIKDGLQYDLKKWWHIVVRCNKKIKVLRIWHMTNI